MKVKFMHEDSVTEDTLGIILHKMVLMDRIGHEAWSIAADVFDEDVTIDTIMERCEESQEWALSLDEEVKSWVAKYGNYVGGWTRAQCGEIVKLMQDREEWENRTQAWEIAADWAVKVKG